MVAEVYKIKVADLRVNSRKQGKNYELTRNAKRLARKVVKNGEFTRNFSFKETSLLVIKKNYPKGCKNLRVYSRFALKIFESTRTEMKVIL